MHIQINKENITIKYCNTFIKKLIGMSFKKKKQSSIYCFPNCNSIHTFFMFQNIDIIMTDKNGEILYMKENMKPNHILLPKKKVYYTYEFSHNEVLYKEIIQTKKINLITEKKHKN